MSAQLFALVALACLPMLKMITSHSGNVQSPQRLSLIPALRQALSYLLDNPTASRRR